MRLTVGCLLAVLTGSGAVAAAEVDCNKAVSTPEITHCADVEREKADKALNDMYQRLMKDARLDEDARKLLREAQRKWIPFRDAECAWQADTMRGGTGANVLYLACLSELTKERVKQLTDAWGTR